MSDPILNAPSEVEDSLIESIEVRENSERKVVQNW